MSEEWETWRLRFAPTFAPTNWNVAAGLIKLIIRIYDEFETKDISLVEVGSFKGESASMFAGSGIFSKIWLVDTWYNKKIEDICKHNMDRYDFVTMLKGTSKATYEGWSIPIDVVYVDAGHDYDSIFYDINNWSTVVKNGGLICGHDYGISSPDVKLVVDTYAKTHNYKLEIFTDSSWLMKKPI
jgi:hypothetical protein|tara:strand:- start:61 stop:612 length:552 start_codon:yes stop_codon:yes gene_type:complete